MKVIVKERLTEGGLLLAVAAIAFVCLSETRSLIPSFPDLDVAGVVFLFIAFVLMFLDRKPFGNLHEKCVVWAGILLLIGIVVMGYGSQFAKVASFGMFFGDISALRNVAMILGVSYILKSTLVGISLMLVVWALESKLGKSILFTGFLLRILIAVYLCAALVSMFATVKSIEKAIAVIAVLEGELPAIIPFVIPMHLLYIAGYSIALGEVRMRRKEVAPPAPAYPPYSGPLHKGKPFYKVAPGREIAYVPIPKTDLREAYLTVICPRCDYVFGATLLLESADQKDAETKCPRCKEDFFVVLPP
ncbi:MAG: hypothetical protein AB1485_02475 [Candidatus Thermoplasmatota archaeon]